MKKIELNGSWQFKAVDRYRQLPSDKLGVTRWMDATVPGTVHTDLLEAKEIPDPFWRTNEQDVQWIDKQQWAYKRKFRLSPSVLKGDSVRLVAEGLDTYARIRINGKAVAETSNMFVTHHFEVKRYLRAGWNTIQIIFDSPTHRSKLLERQYGKLQVANDSHRVYVRKAQYSFGWDWGPHLTTSGIWRDIFLEVYSVGRLEHPFIKVISLSKLRAVVRVSVNAVRTSRRPLTVQLVLAGENFFDERTIRVMGNQVSFVFVISRPQIWWPNGYGDQPLYTAVFTLCSDDEEIHSIQTPFALRSVRLLQQMDKEGKSFVFEINGEKIFCKGADWIPGDSFLPRIPDSGYEKLLTLAKNAHMNMLRVWGGGIYEREIFYDLCDRYGLLVWQDFMYACGEYPNQAWFLADAKKEAENAIRRLRNHASIVVWCGNNECEWLFCTENPDKTSDDMSGARIFRDILPGVCARLDGTRPYWRSSPFGEGFPNSESNGNHHQWLVWSAWRDYSDYEKDNARFVTEFGFQAPANRRTFEEVTISADRQPQSKVMEHHNKQVEGTERLLRFMAAHFRMSESFDGFIYKGQLVQAEALRCAVEHWRRRKFRTAGTLFWQLNDCWPVSSWSVIDSALRPKAAYYYAKKFFAPVLLSFKKKNEVVEIWITNDLPDKIAGSVYLALKSFDGEKVWEKKMNVRISPNASVLITKFHTGRRIRADSQYMWGKFFADGSRVSENRCFFDEPKHLRLPRTKFTVLLEKNSDCSTTLSLRSSKFAKNVRIEIEGEDCIFDDNYFDIDGGEIKEVRFRSSSANPQLRKRLRIRCL